MSDTEVVDATVVEDQPSTDVVVRGDGNLVVTPAVEASELVARLDVIRDAMHNAMTEGVDYGVIPGTQKPTLMKPGAEKLNADIPAAVQDAEIAKADEAYLHALIRRANEKADTQ